MNKVTTISDPHVLFQRWFASPIEQLERLEHGDGGTAGMMVVLPLFERYIHVLEATDTSNRKWYDIMASELGLPSAFEAEKFWTTLRHGFCHTGMPLLRGRKATLTSLPKVHFAAEHAALPRFVTTPDGVELLCIDPWKFIRHVITIYRRDPSLLVRHIDAPLLAIHMSPEPTSAPPPESPTNRPSE